MTLGDIRGSLFVSIGVYSRFFFAFESVKIRDIRGFIFFGVDWDERPSPLTAGPLRPSSIIR